ncbi:MAG: hypothetical protein ACI9UD_001007 [Glaciecola sp.]|jgi:hypothetical protein
MKMRGFLCQVSQLNIAISASSGDWQTHRKNEVVNNRTSICKAIINATCLLTSFVVLEFGGFEGFREDYFRTNDWPCPSRLSQVLKSGPLYTAIRWFVHRAF